MKKRNSGESHYGRECPPVKETLRRANREIAILKQIGHHPHIIGYHGMLHAEKNVYIVMEKADIDMHQLLYTTNCKTLFPAHRQMLLEPILKAVCFLHERGIAHCDLKPANVLIRLSASGGFSSVLLGDFGMAAVAECKGSCAGKNGIPVEGSGGTKGYQAPEAKKARCGKYEGRGGDMWSIGCILMEMTFPDHFHGDWSKICHAEDPDETWLGVKRCVDKMRNVTPKRPETKKLLDLLLEHLLALEPAKRLPAKEALQHLWFQAKDKGETFCVRL